MTAHAHWTPWGDLTDVPQVGNWPEAANDNTPHRKLNGDKPLLIGLTGRRHVGKSTVSELLESTFGFTRVHAFDGGKVAAVSLFEHITGDHDIAIRMVYGDLKDVTSPHLPLSVAPRYFLEKFGRFMGVEMGVDWTLAMEINRVRRMSPASPIVAESLVYEVDWFRANGGYIVRIERQDYDSPSVGSDSFQAAIQADVTISARSVAELEDKALRLVDSLVGTLRVKEALERYG